MYLHRHYYTLYQCVSECSLSLQNHIITDIYSQEKNTLIIQFEYQGIIQALEFSMNSGNSCMYLKGNSHKAKNNAVSIFPELIGMQFNECTIHPFDRIMRISLTGASIVVLFYGGASNAIYSFSKDDTLLSSFKKTTLNIGESFVPLTIPPKSFTSFSTDTRIIDALSSSSLLLGPIYAREVLYRFFEKKAISYTETLCIYDLHSNDIEELLLCAMDVKNLALSSKQFYLYRNTQNQSIVSCIELEYDHEFVWKGESISEAIRRAKGLEINSNSFLKSKENIEKKIGQSIEKIQKSLSQIKDQSKSLERIAKAILYGNLLLEQTHQSHNIVTDTLQCVDHEGQYISIPVIKNKTCIENAELYFEKARKNKVKEKINQQKFPQLLQTLENLQTLKKDISTYNSTKQIESLDSIYSSIVLGVQKTKSQHDSPYRVFELSEDFTVYLGKNAENNDQLTKQFAKPNDVWLHARGVSGSHAIIKGKGIPPKHIIEKAAAITAYYSLSRNASYTPVSYTFKKYIRKKKGSNPGAVFMEREEVIMVKPYNPSS
jgi:predicted ribosome quality control (RQC) complex YloA/Tae2 family protein